MSRTRTLLALLAMQLLALSALAQSSDEFGRASGGSISAITKTPSAFSGSLSLTHSIGRGQGYDGSVGGKLLDDRLWFFAAAAVLPNIQFSTPGIASIDAKATAKPVDWTTVTAAFSRLQQPVFATSVTPVDGSLSTSFLSLRSTSMLSDRTMLNISVSRSLPIDAQ
jgi:hypothetical protein